MPLKDPKNLTEKEKEEVAVLSQEMAKSLELQMKRLVSEGYQTGSVAFILAKMSILTKAANKKQVELALLENLLALKWKVIIAVVLLKLGFGEKFAYLLSRLRKLRYLLRPREVYVMDTHKLYFNWLDLKSRYIFEDYRIKHIWEPETTRLIRQVVRPGDICLDIGASIGYFTLLLSQVIGKTGRVYSFEPMSRCYKYLCKNIEINGYKDRAVAYQLGAWDKNEIVGMPKCDDIPVPTRCVAIGEFLNGEGVTKVDFIKIDIDGSEPWALRGLIPIFENNPQLKMVCEWYPKYILNAGGNPQEVKDILDKYFDLTVIEGDYGEEYWNYYCTRKKC